MNARPLTVAEWRAAAVAAAALPGAALAALYQPLLAARERDDPAWIHRCSDAFVQAQLQRLQGADPAALPLFGVPFAVKDNIDVAGLPTTAACPAYAYTAAENATVVQRLMDAGALLVGKTNLDQFATGLVGTRSPYGEVPNVFDATRVSGGSSSGSASVLARGLVAFALGTDTAGSGRVPAGFNNVVGLKPTPGSVPMLGVVPACRTLDVVSIFALTVADAATVMATMEGAGDEPVFQPCAPRPAWFGDGRRPLRVGVPNSAECAAVLDRGIGYDRGFDTALARLHALGTELQPIDLQPFFDVARLLYDGPWVAERYAVVRPLLERRPDVMDATVRRVIEQARTYDAAAAFDARYALEDQRARLAHLWRDVDLLMLPTAPTCPTRADVGRDPVARNAELGRYTNFVNLLGLAALALPAGFVENGLPFGVTFVAPGGSDAALAAFGTTWEAACAQPLGRHLRAREARDDRLTVLPAAARTLQIAVVGAHLAGQPLHGQLLERACRFVERTTTAPCYRLFALPDTVPPKPGLARSGAGGTAIEVEVYEMPEVQVGSFLALIPPPLGLGSVQLTSGRWVKGFVCEGVALERAADISALGGWRNYVATRRPEERP